VPAPEKNKPTSIGGTCRPTPSQESLLRACFLPGEASAAQALESWRRRIDPAHLDDFSRRVLPLLTCRWSQRQPPIDQEIKELASRVHLAQWEQNRRRIGVAADLQARLAAAGIECAFLKGIALLSRFYGDSGLRGMGDVDLLVHRNDVARAANTLLRHGWCAEENLPAEEIGKQTGVRHAWQFSRADGEICDLHWHPVVRCFNPQIAERFWNGLEPASVGSHPMRVPCATDQLFHVCVHGVQWSWTPQIRWIADAMVILGSGEAVDWRRLYELGAAARMTVRLYAALDYLQRRLDAAVPDDVLHQLAQHRPEGWERREHELLQKPCPLGMIDSVRWHTSNFRRIRPYEPAWSKQLHWIGFQDYLRVFLRSGKSGSLLSSLAAEFRNRTRRDGPGTKS
jgi:hypothetical protein